MLGFWPMLWPAWASGEKLSFNRDVRPILSENCFYCHGVDGNKRKADLRLDVRADALRSDAFVPGDLNASELFHRIHSTDEDEVMPPPESNRILTSEQKKILERWIKEGAEYEKHWAFVAPAKKALPPVKRPEWVRNPIDRFVLSKLDERNLPPSVEAPKEVLIKRLYSDLIGLPPTPREVDSFLYDHSSDAYEKVVDHLLKSPRYGERMALEWLDAARYADSNGFQFDGETDQWVWRDWVVKALNEDMPFDQFTTWQLAGDLLPDSTIEQKVASGFNRNHLNNGEGGAIPEEQRFVILFDRIDVTTTNWLGLTVACAQCHDHKYDPVTQKDYYGLMDAFNQVSETGRPARQSGNKRAAAPFIDAPTEENKKHVDDFKKQIAETEEGIGQRRGELSKERAQWEARMLKDLPKANWTRLTPRSAEAKEQTLEILDGGLIYAKGPNPDTDEYRVVYPLGKEKITGFKLEAVRHPKMTKGGLARSDSGNFVLTDIRFKLRNSAVDELVPLKIQSAQATYEQGPLKIASALDDNPGTGWAVWSGKPIDRNHAAAFCLKEAIEPPKEAELEITLKFNSKHKNHNLGHFRFWATGQPEPSLKGENTGLTQALRKPRDKRSPADEKTISEAFFKKDAALASLLKKKAALEKKLKDYQATKVPKAMVMNDAQKRQTHLLLRGEYLKKGEPVSFSTPSFLPPMKDDWPRNRLGLSKWLLSREQPLTARVQVNRMWQRFFGVGLVKTSEDLGVQSEYPLHLDLLDWLAVEFQDLGWSQKKMHRLIVTSSAYRQSSKMNDWQRENDPENRLVSRASRFRLPSMILRDWALANSGLLVNRLGGAPVFPYQPKKVWEALHVAKNRSFEYPTSKGDDLYRRSLYTFWRRTIGPVNMFDSSDRQACRVKPGRTSTPLHALTTLNDPTWVEASRFLAERAMASATTVPNRLADAFRLVNARLPSANERKILEETYREQLAIYQKDSKAASALLSVGQAKRNENLPLPEHAALTITCLGILNLDQSLTRE